MGPEKMSENFEPNWRRFGAKFDVDSCGLMMMRDGQNVTISKSPAQFDYVKALRNPPLQLDSLNL